MSDHKFRISGATSPEKFFRNIKEAQKAVLATNNEKLISCFHEDKRFSSFIWMDEALEFCAKGECPTKLLVPPLLYLFTDISLENYVWQKSCNPSSDGVGASDHERTMFAKVRIANIFNCKKSPALNSEIFNIDTDEVMDPSHNQTTFKGARDRKAYWSFLAFNPHNNPVSDYCRACGFIEKIHTASSGKNNPHRVKKLVQEHRYMANAIDLYRICIARS